MKKLFLAGGFLFPILFFALTNFSSNTEKIAAQSQTTESCLEITRKYFKECSHNPDYNWFSPKIVEKFGIVNYEDEMRQLDSFKVQLNNDPDATGFIVVYGGRVNRYGEFEERVKRLTNFLFNNLKLNQSRVKVIHGGFREKFEFELWIAPVKGSFPPLSPTVDVEKVIFKGKMKPLHTEMGT